MDSFILSVLARPGNLSFPSNRSVAGDFAAAGGHVIRQPSGHLIFYAPGHRRILATDPEGNPLHECEWVASPTGTMRLSRARFRLDWGQWVGLKPGGLVNSTVLDLSKKPGWERLRADDLRQMAAHTLHVPLEEVRFFYGDDDLVIDQRGQATIHHRKDAFYVLDEGTFHAPPDRIRFMACLGAMHWERIDFLPVVELFQSLLPGTGSAAFELIRGLYDDQNDTRSEPLPLRYRGIPTYPSEAAFRLFSGFFVPHAPGGESAFDLFTEPSRSHEVTWLPTPDPPRRYFDTAHNLCVTIKGSTIQKATLADDPAGLSFVNAGPQGIAPHQRSLGVSHGTLVLTDDGKRTELPISPTWGVARDSQGTSRPEHEQLPPSRSGWRAFFGGTPPEVAPFEAFSAVLLYPDEDREIGEIPTQPFVADYIEDLVEDVPDLASRLAQANDVLIDNFDATLTTCINLSRPRTYTILYRHAAYAQKQGQALWMLLAHQRRLNWIDRVRFLEAGIHWQQIYQKTYDVIYEWEPFGHFMKIEKLGETAAAVAKALRPGGVAFVVGPSHMNIPLQANRLRIIQSGAVEQFPTFRMHRSIMPRARIRSGLTLFHLAKG